MTLFNRLKTRLLLPRTQQILTLEIAALWVVASFFLPGGENLYRYYQPFQQGCDTCGFVPPFARWFLWPLTVLPAYPLTCPLWTLISVTAFLLLAHWTKVNSLLLVLSFPLWGLLWLGQVDWLIACGLVLFLLAKHPALRGFGNLLAMLKLQLSVLAILALLVQEKPLTILKITALPLAGFLLSLWVYGIRRAAAPLAAGRVGYVALRDIFHLAAIPFPQPAPATGCQPVGFVNSHSLFWGIFLR